MEFTAMAMQEANERPVLNLPLGSRVLVYEGRILSAPEWFPFWERYLDLLDAYRAAKDADGLFEPRKLADLERRALKLHLDYLRAVFPKHRYRWWAPDPVKKLAGGHPKNLRDAFHAFFSLQARAMGHGEPTSTSPSTDGTSSSGSTPVGSETL